MKNDRRAYDRAKLEYSAELMRSLSQMLDQHAPQYMVLILAVLASCAEKEATGK